MGFSEEIIGWYSLNKRDLPWRKTTDPYRIWMSEIILQQTRVDQGLNYYNKFIETFPTINLLASASEQEVLNLWQGLGYYSIARNLHFTAKLIVNEYDGIFPTTYKEVLSLKGVGEYTAAAITSFAYKLSYPVVDGNVYRVLSRVFGITTPIDTTEGKKTFKKLAEELIYTNNPAEYNQSIMEFGALQCTPKTPNCENCPLRLQCYALKNNLISVLPKKEKKIKQRDRFFNYLVLIDDQYIYLKERTAKDIWIGLYDFPLFESTQPIDTFKEIQANFKNTPFKYIKKTVADKHILSHQKIYATFWEVSIGNTPINTTEYRKIPLNELHNYPVPKLIDNYLASIL